MITRNKWQGQAGFIVGGGPSFDPAMAPVITAHGRVIAVNAAYRDIPNADCLYFADKRFYEWNCELPEWAAFRGPKITSCRYLHHVPELVKLGSIEGSALSESPGNICGASSGIQAINLAYLLGLDPIVLLGFDMKPNGNFHDYHLLKNRQGHYESKFVPSLERMAKALEGKVRVWNTCLDSGERVFPKKGLEECLDTIRLNTPIS